MRTGMMSAAGVVLATLAPVAAATAATHVTATQSVNFDRPLQMMGGVSVAGAAFGDAQNQFAGGVPVDAFDANLGVLVATNRAFIGSISLRSTLLFDTDFASSPTNYYAPGQSAQASAQGYFKDNASGGTPIAGLASHTLSCVADQTGSCFTEKTTTVAASSSVQLTGSALVGQTTASGPQNVFFETGYYVWDAETSNNNGFTQLFNYLSTKGTQTVNYEYMDHANASFSAASDTNLLTLDFGTVAQNSAVGSKLFSLANLGDAYTVGLDLDSFAASEVSPFSTNLTAFSGLAAGDQRDFLAYFDSSALGTFSVDYVLKLLDADVGQGLANSQITLRLTGVVGPAGPTGPCTTRVCSSPTPEPSTWAMMVLGFGGLGMAARRRRVQAA